MKKVLIGIVLLLVLSTAALAQDMGQDETAQWYGPYYSLRVDLGPINAKVYLPDGVGRPISTDSYQYMALMIVGAGDRPVWLRVSAYGRVSGVRVGE